MQAYCANLTRCWGLTQAGHDACVKIATEHESSAANVGCLAEQRRYYACLGQASCVSDGGIDQPDGGPDFSSSTRLAARNAL